MIFTWICLSYVTFILLAYVKSYSPVRQNECSIPSGTSITGATIVCMSEDNGLDRHAPHLTTRLDALMPIVMCTQPGRWLFCHIFRQSHLERAVGLHNMFYKSELVLLWQRISSTGNTRCCPLPSTFPMLAKHWPIMVCVVFLSLLVILMLTFFVICLYYGFHATITWAFNCDYNPPFWFFYFSEFGKTSLFFMIWSWNQCLVVYDWVHIYVSLVTLLPAHFSVNSAIGPAATAYLLSCSFWLCNCWFPGLKNVGLKCFVWKETKLKWLQPLP